MVDGITNGRVMGHFDQRAVETKSIEETNVKAAFQSQGLRSLGDLFDTANVSNKARALFEAEHFGRMAQALPESRNDTVTSLRDLVQHGRIQEILSKYDDNSLADSLLKSPAAAFLR